MNTITTIGKKEPAVGIGASITAILYAVYALLRASGVEVTDEMTVAVDALVLALCAIPAVSSFVTRFFVYSPATVELMTNPQDAARARQRIPSRRFRRLARSSR